MANRDIVDKVFQQDTFQNRAGMGGEYDAFQIYDVLPVKLFSNPSERGLSDTTQRGLVDFSGKVLTNVTARGLVGFTGRGMATTTNRDLGGFTGKDLANTTDRDLSNSTNRDLSDDNDEFRELE